MDKRTTSLLVTGAIALVLMASAPAGAGGIRLTDAQMDRITAGEPSVSASAYATAAGSIPGATLSVTHSDALSNPYLAYGTGIAVSYGDQGATAAANVTPAGGSNVVGFNNTLTAPNFVYGIAFSATANGGL